MHKIGSKTYMDRINQVRLPAPGRNSIDQKRWSLLLDDDKCIVSIDLIGSDENLSGENWNGDFLSPMGIVLQFNGGLGLAFTNITFDDQISLLNLLDQLWKDGVEAISPTFVSCSISSLHLGLEVLREIRLNHNAERCKLLGAHLEGPFLNIARKGAHDSQYIIPPSLLEFNQRISGFEEEILLLTLAPELEGSMEIIKKSIDLGIICSLGHSEADSDSSRKAFDSGITMLTHTLNAMRGLDHRYPGPVIEAIKNGSISLGLIADGIHVHPDIVNLLYRVAHKQLVLVSDAISTYGLEDGQYFWDQRRVFVKDGECRLEDGTLAGSTLPLLEGCKRLSKWSGDPGASIWSATVAPRLILDKSRDYHEIFIGKPLNKLLRWKFNFQTNDLFWQKAA